MQEVKLPGWHDIQKSYESDIRSALGHDLSNCFIILDMHMALATAPIIRTILDDRFRYRLTAIG